MPGNQQSHSAYRSELAGLMAISVVLKLLSCCLSSPSHIIMGCDGQAALPSLSTCRDALKATLKHSNIQSVIIDLWTPITMALYPVHLKGHQDTIEHNLSRLEEMNILVDQSAMLTASEEAYLHPQCPVLMQLGFIPVQCKDKFICGDVYHTLYTCLTKDHLREYISTKLLSSSDEWTYINFQAFTAAQK